MTRVIYKGALFDSRTADMLKELDRLTPTIPVRFMQGSYSHGVTASAGTHDGGGAVDVAASNLTDAQRQTVVEIMRELGFTAWLRTPAEGFAWHIHGIAVGCPDLSPSAAAQVVAYRGGGNGLVRGRDDGPRDHVGATWESYCAARRDAMTAPSIVTVGPVGRQGLMLQLGDRKHALLTQEDVAVSRRFLDVLREMNARERDVIAAILNR